MVAECYNFDIAKCIFYDNLQYTYLFDWSVYINKRGVVSYSNGY